MKILNQKNIKIKESDYCCSLLGLCNQIENNSILSILNPSFTASDGVALYEQARLHNKTIDVIVAQYDLEIMNAIDVLERIRSHNSEVIFIILADAKITVKQVLKALKLGVSEILIEPYTEDEIILAINTAIENRNKQITLQRNQKEVEMLFSVLHEHNLISKTNPYGVITYVNNIFCEFSGYKKEELVGFSHNIIRHPDTPKVFYEQLWNTISSGNAWCGTIKNISKHNTEYTVNALIMPLFDKNNVIEGYVSSCHIVTSENETINKADLTVKTLKKNFIALKSELLQKTREAYAECDKKIEQAIAKTNLHWRESNQLLQDSLSQRIEKHNKLAAALNLREMEVASTYEKTNEYNRKIKENNKIVEDLKQKTKEQVEYFKKENNNLISKNLRLEEEVKQLREQLLSKV